MTCLSFKFCRNLQTMKEDEGKIYTGSRLEGKEGKKKGGVEISGGK